MSKIHSFSIVLSFIGLWVSSTFVDEFEIVLAFVLIFSFGILHGSNDLALINSIFKSQIKYSFYIIIGFYLAIVLSAIILFYLLPSLALSLFLIFSAFHFGEQHWEHHDLLLSKIGKSLFYFIYGLVVIQLLFVFNTKEVINIILSITGQQISENAITWLFLANVSVLFIIIMYLFFRQHSFRKTIGLELFYLLLFSIIFKVSSLIWGFAIYFVLWHSLPSLLEQIIFIYGDYNRKNMLDYCKKAFPYWIISLAGIAMLYFIFKGEKLFYAIFFSFIAAVTFPHALVINKMFTDKNSDLP